MPESKIVNIKCKSVNVAILIENSQIWYQGEFDMDKDEESPKSKNICDICLSQMKTKKKL